MERPHLRTENYLRELLQIYFAQQRLILLTTLAVFLAAAAIAFLAPPIYSAQGAILLRASELQRSPQSLEETEVRSFKVSEEDLRSERELLRSPAVQQGAIARLKESHPELGATLDWHRVRNRLQIELVPDSRVINVEFQHADATAAVVILDAILAAYIERRAEILYPEGTVDFFVNQVERFRDQISTTEQALIELANTTGTPDPTKEIELNLLIKQNVEERLLDLDTRAVTLREQLEHLDRTLATDQLRNYAFITNQTVAEIAARIIDLRIERGRTARHYEPDAHAVAAIDTQIATTMEQLKQEVADYRDQLDSEFAALREQQLILQRRLAEIEARNLELQRQGIESDRLSREAELLRQSFGTFFKRREEAEINAGVDSTLSLFFVSILSPAFSTGQPVFPNRPVLLVIGLLAGFVTGFSLGFVREFFDHTFKTARDVEQFSGLPLLFSIPAVNAPSPEPSQPPPR
ncbi:Wzz/FepE/Etk N-terminal domain-containing protein [Marichromatium sp. AB31]|uniref:GumC family protein n=1 Tax=Marichromatium sp. AB31 TaxID=2483362 RepID=UPI000F3E51B7|nr:Wzz/FepE/Etk N-terminal domain-containing protein [Marichromatium sp. AB31]RNE91694.1 lipopolysaccharide biosynthesis protein [Marichromatium sp. AB31]